MGRLYGQSGWGDDEMCEEALSQIGDDPKACYIIAADVPVPEVRTIEGRVEGDVCAGASSRASPCGAGRAADAPGRRLVEAGPGQAGRGPTARHAPPASPEGGSSGTDRGAAGPVPPGRRMADGPSRPGRGEAGPTAARPAGPDRESRGGSNRFQTPLSPPGGHRPGIAGA